MSGCPVKDEDRQGGECPVGMGAGSSSSGAGGTGTRTWSSWLWGDAATAAPTGPAGAAVPADYNANASDLAFGQQRHKDQTHSLSTVRQKSTIKKADISPHHQPGDATEWVYPSEQQYFNAMKRKGYDPKVADHPTCPKQNH